MNPLTLIGVIGTITQGIPEIKAAMGAISAMIQDQPLTPADYQALGAAMLAAHERVQGTVPAPAAAPASPPSAAA